MADSKFDIETLRRHLDYDPATGLFAWKLQKSSRAKVGQIAGSANHDGYWIIGFMWKRYAAHRLAWFYMHGEWPAGELDHINGDRADNRMCNLRLASHSENMQNLRKASRRNATGLLGVTYLEYWGKWKAQITHKRRVRNLGMFDSPKKAHEAYLKAKRELHPFGTI